MRDRAVEHAVVVGTERSLQSVAWGFRRSGLQQFLQITLGVLDFGSHRQRGDFAAEQAQDQSLHLFETPIQEDGAEERFEAVSQGGLAVATAVGFLAAADKQVQAEVDLSALVGEEAAVDQPRTRLGQLPFAEGREAFVEVPSEDKLEGGVAEELEPLVMLELAARFMGHRRVRERESEESLVAKGVSEFRLECLEVGHRQAG
jgi:hypothetical protein